MMTTVAVTGLSSGRISVKKNFGLLAPSTMPASSIEAGMARMNAVYRKMANGRLVLLSTSTMPQ